YQQRVMNFVRANPFGGGGAVLAKFLSAHPNPLPQAGEGASGLAWPAVFSISKHVLREDRSFPVRGSLVVGPPWKTQELVDTMLTTLHNWAAGVVQGDTTTILYPVVFYGDFRKPLEDLAILMGFRLLKKAGTA
ncbi:MAG: hypothetical protein JW829_00435, partial [Pirellulales bacterium]|nr:hypothetical protein [Pirellulales bacterium]